MGVSTYHQSVFDKAFVQAVKFLKKEELLRYKDFAKTIEIPQSNLTEILQAKRGVPEHRKSYAKFKLVNEFKVRPEFLDTNTGPILSTPLTPNEKEYPQFSTLLKENALLKAKVAELETRMADNQKLIDTQFLLINSLTEQLKASGHKPGQKK
jgi:hypothetical protein